MFTAAFELQDFQGHSRSYDLLIHKSSNISLRYKIKACLLLEQ